MSEAKFLIGIDLGTSNCAVAAVNPGEPGKPKVFDFPIPQLVQLGEVSSRPLLPSCVYLPAAHELSLPGWTLPWDPTPKLVVGEFARWQGARVAGRLVTSAKSWLCHRGVDRTAAILPWGAPAEVAKMSPVDASQQILQHICQAWNQTHPNAPIAAQEVALTVPASFDEAARAFTVNAARKAGLEKFVLLEEPQAAFYDFVREHEDKLAQILEGIRLVLVVDVGGGTTDLTLVTVASTPDGPALKRIAVGEHLILGGDNMDAALARHAEEKMFSGSRRLSSGQWSQMLQAARLAKEALLQPGSPETYRVSVAGEGSKLIGAAQSVTISRAEIENLILNGFFPVCAPEASPARTSSVGLQEFGLPFAADPAISRHIASFLRAHAPAAFAALGIAEPASPLPRPDAILLNGGVFNSSRIAQRLVEVLANWWPDQPPVKLLPHSSLDLAVARGAAQYAMVRRGLGRRISGGAAHALYLGIEEKKTREALALCIIQRGHEEGDSVELNERIFHLTLGKPVKFPLFSSTADQVHVAGQIIKIEEGMQALPPLRAVLTGKDAGVIPVHLRATLTEIGTLELWCVSERSSEQWRLEFDVRGEESENSESTIGALPASFVRARQFVQAFYGSKNTSAQFGDSLLPKSVKQLFPALERICGGRKDWPVSGLRDLWGAVYAGGSRRRRSADHERVFFQLAGYTLRPGFGYPLDEWRCEQLFKIFPEGVQYHKERPNWSEFWIMWRRIAGGLPAASQRQIWEYLKPHLATYIPPYKVDAVGNRSKGIAPEGLDEMTRLAASLESIDPDEKRQLGEWILGRMTSDKQSAGPWAFSLARLGARVLVHGSPHLILPPDVASKWVEVLLESNALRPEETIFVVTQLARKNGDRSHDVDDLTRNRVLEYLRSQKAPSGWLQMMTEVARLNDTDQARMLGDTLPVGLQLTQ